MSDTDIQAKLAELEQRILYLEQQQQDGVLKGYPFGTWKEYPPSQGAPQAYTDQMTPSYHCTYEHP